MLGPRHLFRSILLASALSLFGSSLVFSQVEAPPPQTETDPEEDVVTATGTLATGNHAGMDAFFKGDFETAEIEFEQEFKSLRRFRSAQENAAFDADVSFDRAAAVSDSGTNAGSAANTRNGAGGAQGAPSGSGLTNSNALSTNFVNRRSEGTSVLTDGKVTFEDFAFTRYMSGLSEIKLGKYTEAKDSLKTSLHWDKGNYDARMRLGMIYLMERDYDRAADELEALDKMRKRCVKSECDEMEPLRDATVTLATELTRAIEAIN